MPELMERLAMSQRERDRLVMIRSVNEGKRTQAEAAKLLCLSTRQVRRLQERVRREKDVGVIHKLRGRPSNSGVEEAQKRRVLGLYRSDYGGDYGPTLFSEKLSEQHGIKLCAETLRQWLLSAGLWQRKRKRDRHRRRRERRASCGELVQIDASHHDWLEGRGKEKLVLCAMIDDATSRVMARFYPGETTEAYFDLFRRYLLACGKPAALYSDKAGIFRTERSKRNTEQDFHPEFGRAMEELNVRLILANSPQAKGRVERLFGTCQDRWVKELREAKIRSLAGANELLERKLLGQFNDRFTVKAASSADAHLPAPCEEELSAILCPHQERRVGNDYTVRFENQVLQIAPPALPGLRGGKVTLEQRLNGKLKMRFKERYLVFEAIPPAAASRPAGRDAAAGGQFNLADGADSSTLV